MDKNTMIQNLARELNEKDAFNGAWLYAENGEIVSKGVLGFRDSSAEQAAACSVFISPPRRPGDAARAPNAPSGARS